MAKDYHIRGYNTPEMAKIADHYRKMLGVENAEHIGIVDLIEFELRKFYDGFRLVIKPDREITDPAYTDFEKNQIVVRESVYVAAHEGDFHSRMVLAHELGHYLLHGGKGKVVMHKTKDGSYDSIKGLNSTESTEDQADMFATLFMVRPSIAFTLKEDCQALSKTCGVPLDIAASAISAAKRHSLRTLTHKARKRFSASLNKERDPEEPKLL